MIFQYFLFQICVVKERVIQRSDLPPLVVEIGGSIHVLTLTVYILTIFVRIIYFNQPSGMLGSEYCKPLEVSTGCTSYGELKCCTFS